MAEKYTESQKKASLKYAKENLKRVPLDLKKEEYERLSAAAKSADMSINGFVKAAINEKISNMKMVRWGDGMSNFDRIKNCESEYEMSNLICGYICNNLHKLTEKDSPEFHGLPFLEWLRSDRDIFDEETTEQ